ncbi:MAG TPA: fibronectin type III domain-containing protein, partial [Verrucomicrobiae bacterium]|nr:fibronectin type III domain-containing protein [Verrucomicrobiae bacterium]
MTRNFCSSRWQVGCTRLLGILIFGVSILGREIPRKYAVQISAAVQESPARIVLSWPNEGDAISYRVSRRTLDSGWQWVGTLGGADTSYTESNVNLGTKYEYQIIKSTSSDYSGYGYISAGIRIPVVDSRGKVIILVESSLAGALEGELNRLQDDLIGDGWGVIRRAVSAADSPSSVKEVIRNIYGSESDVRALFLVGHVPVPYSGNYFP